MDDEKLRLCKQICVQRFTTATIYSLMAQITPLIVFLLFVNFDLFHPLNWLGQTFSLVFSIYTWMYMVPLIVMVFLHGIVLSKIYMTKTNYYRNRFVMHLKTIGKKFITLVSLFGVGFQTAWMFVKIFERNGGEFSTESRWFILSSGAFMGIYYFVKEKMKLKQDLDFPLIQQSRFLRIRDQFYSNLYRSLRISITPTMIFVLIFCSCTPLFKVKITDYWLDISALIMNWKIVYVLILSSQILSQMYFLEQLFVIFLTESRQFPIENSTGDLTLSEALAIDQFKIINELASLDLFTLSFSSEKTRRQAIYALTIPGGHPYNWKSLSDTSLKIISEFTKELSTSIDIITTFEKNKTVPEPNPAVTSNQKGLATLAAEKILTRQLNESYNVRNMSVFLPEDNQPQNLNLIQRIPHPQEINHKVENYFWSLKQKIFTIPIIHYLLGEQHYERSYFILKKSQRLIWITQGLAALTSHSIKEDNFGVVQKTLPQIVQKLLELKAVLDKVENINLGRKKIKLHHKKLKSAVKRSLYMIASSFGDYLNDLIMPETDRSALLVYVNYKEP